MSEKAPIPAQGLDHVSIAVPDLDAAIRLYRERFGCEVSEPSENPRQGVRMAMIRLENARIELMEPLGEDSPIAGFLERNPAGGIHHFCLTTPDVDSAAAAANKNGLRVLGEPTPDSRLFFIHPKDSMGTLIEIEETD